MPDEYDAFGRRKDDAGLGGLGRDSAETPDRPDDPRSVAPVSGRKARPRRLPGVLVGIATLAVIAVTAAVVIGAGQRVKDSVRESLDGLRTLTTNGGGTEIGEGDDVVPEPVRAASFFTPRGLRAGLKILAKEQPGRIFSLSVRRDRINLQVIRGGRTHIVQLSAGAEAPEEHAVSAATSTGRTIGYRELRPAAPERLMRAANARLHASPGKIDYLVAQKFTGALQWGVYYKNATIALGDSRGRFVRRIA